MVGLGFKPSRKASGGFPQPILGQPPKCPECCSERVWRDGVRYLNDGSSVQRWLCRSCGYRFSEPNVKFNISSQIGEALKPRDNHHEAGVSALDFAAQKALDDPSFPLRENVTPHDKHQFSTAEKDLNNLPFYNRKRRVSVSEDEAKNSAGKAIALAEEKGLSEKRAAGATETSHNKAEFQGKIIEFLWWMKKQGYKDTTIKGKGSRLRRLAVLGANLYDPESVKEVLAKQAWADSSKETTAYAYDLFAKWAGIKWERPSFKPPRKLPFIPLEREIDDLIAGCSNRTVSAFLQIAKETGARAGEIFNLKWVEVDFEGRTIRITPEKGSDPRMFRMSSKLIGMLENLPKNGERIFGNYKRVKDLSRTFERHRKKLAFKLGNTRLLRISFHTIRHWKATMEYHKTKDILYVMKLLGHRDIKNTLIYTQLIHSECEDEYICKAAKTVKEASELIEKGFEYVCEVEGVKLFRKRK